MKFEFHRFNFASKEEKKSNYKDIFSKMDADKIKNWKPESKSNLKLKDAVRKVVILERFDHKGFFKDLKSYIEKFGIEVKEETKGGIPGYQIKGETDSEGHISGFILLDEEYHCYFAQISGNNHHINQELSFYSVTSKDDLINFIKRVIY